MAGYCCSAFDRQEGGRKVQKKKKKKKTKKERPEFFKRDHIAILLAIFTSFYTILAGLKELSFPRTAAPAFAAFSRRRSRRSVSILFDLKKKLLPPKSIRIEEKKISIESK